MCNLCVTFPLKHLHSFNNNQCTDYRDDDSQYCTKLRVKFYLKELIIIMCVCVRVCACMPMIPFCLIQGVFPPCVPRTGSRSTVNLIRIKLFLKTNERNFSFPVLFACSMCTLTCALPAFLLHRVPAACS